MVSYAKSNELTFAIHKPSVTCDLWSVNFKFVVSKFFHSFQLYPNKWDSRTVFRCADYKLPEKNNNNHKIWNPICLVYLQIRSERSDFPFWLQ